MGTLNVRFYDEELALIASYASDKKISKAAAVRELINSALRFEIMKKENRKNNNTEDENLKKLSIEHAAFSMEATYLVRELLSFLMENKVNAANKGSKEIKELAKTTAHTFVKTRMNLDIE